MMSAYTLILVAVVVFSGLSYKDAYGAPAGLLSYGVRYSNTSSSEMVYDGGEKFSGNETRFDSVTPSVAYTPTNEIQVRAWFLITKSQYDGEFNSVHEGEYDNGDPHTDVTDLSLQVGYSALENQYLTVLPFLRYTDAITDYEVRGFSAPGRGLREIAPGFEAGGQILDPAFWSASYLYAFVEKSEHLPDYNINRSEITALVGYSFLENATITVGAERVITDGGIKVKKGFVVCTIPAQYTFPSTNFGELCMTPEEFEWHDQVRRVRYTTAGFGLDYSFGSSTIAFDYRDVIDAQNTSDAKIISLSYTMTDFL